MKITDINENAIIVMKSLLLTIIAIILLELTISLMREIGLQIISDNLIGNVLLQITIFLVQYLIIRKYNKENLLSSIGFNNENSCLEYILIGISIGFICSITLFFGIFLMKIVFYEGIGFEFYSFKTIIAFIVSTLIRALFAGTCEEVFFRGVILNYSAKYKGKLFGLTISSIIFALFHTMRYETFNQLFSVLITGIVLGYLYLKTKSLYMSVGLHASTDFFMNLAGTKSESCLFILGINSGFSSEYLIQIMFSLISIIYFTLFFILILISKKKLTF